MLIHDLASADEAALRAAIGTPDGAVRRVQLSEAIAALARAGFGVGLVNRAGVEALATDRRLVEARLTARYRRRYWGGLNSSELPLKELAIAIQRSTARSAS